jgi:cell division septation protein DedD
MEEQTSWKGHAFTLMIFGGIVVLCSIFFVLGMLVGRTQTVKIGAVAAADAAPKPAMKEAPLTESLHAEVPLTAAEKEPRFTPAPVKPDTESPAAAPAAKIKEQTPPEPTAPPPVTINWQISALGKQSDAEKLVDELKKKGFRAFMLTPAPDETKPYYRVQVGAADRVEAESLKRKLEAAGYKPILKQ